MTLTAFLSATLALLLAPGPTNTLMGLAGAKGGIARAARLIPAELLGYLAAVLPLLWLGAEVMAHFPAAAVALKLLAGAWVMYLAVRLWGLRGTGSAESDVTPRRVFLTTLLNPKALIFGLVLLPAPGDPQLPLMMALFGGCIIGVALIWGALGAATQAGSGRSPARGESRLLLLRRLASAWLAVVSVTLIAGVIAG